MTFIKRIARGAAIFGTMLIGLSAPSAQAGYVVDLTQQGSNVVATGSGPIDLTGLSFFATIVGQASLVSSIGHIITGPTGFTPTDLYTGFTGPADFGSGDLIIPAGSGSGDVVGITAAAGEFFVPSGYVSGTSLSDTATYDSQTFSSLGVTRGRYEWTWGTGANQNFTLVVVPEPSAWAMMLLGFAGLGFAGYRAAHRSTPIAA